MSAETKEVNVYWSPASFVNEDPQWNLLYSEPKNVYDNLISDTNGTSLAIRCPATRNIMKNIYSLHSRIDDEFSLADANLSEIEKDTSADQYSLNLDSKCDLFRHRASSYPGYVNLSYNMSWLFFSDEPLKLRMSAPYYPTSSPVDGAMFAFGEFDIGQWFRHLTLDYQIPITAEKFSIKEGQPLAFLEFFTDKKINLHRFRTTTSITQLSKENMASPVRYGKRKTLEQRYEMFNKSGMREVVMSEIKKNLV